MKRIVYIILSTLCVLAVQAQSSQLERAKALINEEKYLEGAKLLRPLADGGNAEAQFLAAWLFFTGNGVTKNFEQGVNYATLSVEQGNFDSLLLLADVYRVGKKKKEAFALVDKYIVPNKDYQEKALAELNNKEQLRFCLEGYSGEVFRGYEEDEMAIYDKVFSTNPAKGEFAFNLALKLNEKEIQELPLIMSYDNFEKELEEKRGMAPPYSATQRAFIAWHLLDGRLLGYNPVLAQKYVKESVEGGSAMGKYVADNKFTEKDKQYIAKYEKEEAAKAAMEKRKEEEKIDAFYTSQVFDDVDTQAQFLAGENGFKQHMEKNLRCAAKDFKEKVKVEIVIEKDGSTKNVNVINPPSQKVEAEICRVFQSLPMWIPAKKDNRNVSQRRVFYLGAGSSGKVTVVDSE